MKFSIEAKVAAAVATCFTLLSICAIAQEQGQHAAGSAAAVSQATLRVSSDSLSSTGGGY
jgi:hypothetical protein